MYVYYQLKNFYQNHRTYVKSRSDKQLLGHRSSKDEMDDCLPRKYAKVPARAARAPFGRARSKKSLTRAPRRLNGVKKQLWPCGLVANSLFNDVISLPSDSPYTLDETGIAWDTDVENKCAGATPCACSSPDPAQTDPSLTPVPRPRSFLSRFNQPEGYKSATVACANIASCSNKTTCAARSARALGCPRAAEGIRAPAGATTQRCRIRPPRRRRAATTESGACVAPLPPAPSPPLSYGSSVPRRGASSSTTPGGFEPLPVSPWPSPREAGAPNTDRAYPSPHFAHKATSFIPRSSRPSSAW